MDYTLNWRHRTLLDIFELGLLDDTWGRTHSLMMDILSSFSSSSSFKPWCQCRKWPWRWFKHVISLSDPWTLMLTVCLSGKATMQNCVDRCAWFVSFTIDSCKLMEQRKMVCALSAFSPKWKKNKLLLFIMRTDIAGIINKPMVKTEETGMLDLFVQQSCG